jgi:hypothetical protein
MIREKWQQLAEAVKYRREKERAQETRVKLKIEQTTVFFD